MRIWEGMRGGDVGAILLRRRPADLCWGLRGGLHRLSTDLRRCGATGLRVREEMCGKL